MIKSVDPRDSRAVRNLENVIAWNEMPYLETCLAAIERGDSMLISRCLPKQSAAVGAGVRA